MPFLIFILAFGVLTRIAYGVLSPYRDSGDLVAASASLGIAHPPGYPLYVLLCKAWLTAVPFANAAFRANLFSALCSAAAAALLYLALSRWVSKTAAGIGALFWILAPSVVQLSIVSEMYALNALICALTLWAASRSRDCAEPGQSRWTALAFFLLGLGLNNHPTLIFLAPGLALYAWTASPLRTPLERFASLIRLSLWSALGFTLVFFDPIRSFQDPRIDWGDPETLRNWWRLITRSDYGGLRLHPEQSRFVWSGTSVINQLALFCRAAFKEMGWLGLPLFALGFVLSLIGWVRKDFRRPEILLIGVPWLFAGPLFFLLSNLPIHEKTTMPILEPYMLMVHLMASASISFGWDQIVNYLSGKLVSGKLAGTSLHIRPVAAALTAAVLVAIAFPLSRRNQFYAYDYGKNLAKTMPLQSSLYEPDDVTAFTLSYLQVGEGHRPDIALLMTLKTFWGYEQIKQKYPDIVPAGEFPNAQGFIAALLARHGAMNRPLFADHPSKFPSGMPQYPAGMLARSGAAPSIDAFKAAQSIFHFYVERGSIRMEGKDFFARHLLTKMSAALNNAGIWLQNEREYDAARSYFERALGRDSGLTPAWNNLGLNHFLRSDYAGAERVFRLGLARGEAPVSLYTPLGLSQRRLGEFALAKQSLQAGVKARESDLTALNELGLISMQERKLDEAKGYFERAIRAQENYSTAHYNLGLVHRAMGMRREAAENFQNYLRYDPKASDAAAVRGWVSNLTQN